MTAINMAYNKYDIQINMTYNKYTYSILFHLVQSLIRNKYYIQYFYFIHQLYQHLKQREEF